MLKRFDNLQAFGYDEPMWLVELKKNGQVMIEWWDDEKTRLFKDGSKKVRRILLESDATYRCK